MQVKALKSFQGRHGYIRAGQTVNLEDSYARDLARNSLVQLVGEGSSDPKPQNRQAADRAPYRAGAAQKPGPAARLGDGPAMSPLSSRAGQARAKPTQKKSATGAKNKPAPAVDPNAAS